MPMATTKDTLRALLVEGRLEEIAAMTSRKKRILGSLVAMTFDHDLEVVWRAIEAMGMAAEALSARHPNYVKEHVRRLYWLITEESGGVFWRAPECMAECGARLPSLLPSHVTIAFHLIETLEDEDLEHFRPGALWAVGRLVDVARKDLPGVLPLVEAALDHADPQTRGMAVWCLEKVGESARLKGRGGLLHDPGPVNLYRNRTLERTTVGRLVGEVLA